MSTKHSFPQTRRLSHQETTFVCLACSLDNNIVPKRANRVLALDNASICCIADGSCAHNASRHLSHERLLECKPFAWREVAPVTSQSTGDSQSWSPQRYSYHF